MSNIKSITENEYKHALNRIAFHCSINHPKRVLWDKRLFQPSVPFNKDWYQKNVLPSNEKAGIVLLAHITGKVT